METPAALVQKYGQNGALKNNKSRPGALATKVLSAKTTIKSYSDTILPMVKALRAYHPSLAV